MHDWDNDARVPKTWRDGDDDMVALSAWRGGDKQAGTRLFKRYQSLLQRYFANKAPAEHVPDLVNQTFLALRRSSTTLHSENVRAYIFGVARNVLLHFLRGLRSRQENPQIAAESLLDGGNPENLDPERAFADREYTHLLFSAIRTLPMASQVVLALSYWEGLTATQISAVLQIPLGTVFSRMRLAKESLRRALSTCVPEEWEPDLPARWLSTVLAHVADMDESSGKGP